MYTQCLRINRVHVRKQHANCKSTTSVFAIAACAALHGNMHAWGPERCSSTGSKGSRCAGLLLMQAPFQVRRLHGTHDEVCALLRIMS